MTRFLLKSLNPVILVLFAILGVAIQSSLFTFSLLPYLQPDVLLLVVIWCALRRKFFEGGVLTLIVGQIAENHSASPSGTYMILYMTVYLGLRSAARLLVIPDLRSYVTVALVAGVLTKVGALAFVQLLGVPVVAWKHNLVMILPNTVATAIVGKWVFQGLDRFDWVTFKNARAEQILEEEMQLEASEF